MAKRRRLGIECIHAVTLWYMRAQKLAITDKLLAAIRAMATPQTLARKGSKGYAPCLVAGGIDNSSSEDE